jgi:hypothetical protein
MHSHTALTAKKRTISDMKNTIDDLKVQLETTKQENAHRLTIIEDLKEAASQEDSHRMTIINDLKAAASQENAHFLAIIDDLKGKLATATTTNARLSTDIKEVLSRHTIGYDTSTDVVAIASAGEDDAPTDFIAIASVGENPHAAPHAAPGGDSPINDAASLLPSLPIALLMGVDASLPEATKGGRRPAAPKEGGRGTDVARSGLFSFKGKVQKFGPTVAPSTAAISTSSSDDQAAAKRQKTN